MKKYFSLIGLLVLLPALTGCTWWGGGETTTPEETTPTETTPPEETTPTTPPLDYFVVDNVAKVLGDAHARYNQAEKMAKGWQSDAKLLIVSTKFYAKLTDDGVSDRFLFSSDIKPDLYMAVDVSRTDATKFTRSLIFRQDYALKSDVKPVPLQYWKIAGVEAIELADSLGGAQYRLDNPNYMVSEVLSLAGGKNLAWYIVYSSGDSTNKFELVVDANTGGVIN